MGIALNFTAALPFNAEHTSIKIMVRVAVDFSNPVTIKTDFKTAINGPTIVRTNRILFIIQFTFTAIPSPKQVRRVYSSLCT